MEYTLDSVHLVKAALKKQFPGYQVFSEERIIAGSEMAKMTEEENRLFFGILTVSDARKANLTFRNGALIAIDAGSQIGAQLFTAADFTDVNDVAAEPEGLFLGHEIRVQEP